MEQSCHVILKHIDNPVRFLFWTKFEILIFILPCFLGLIMDQFLIGCLISFLNLRINKFYKRRFGKGQCQSIFFWYLPLQNNFKGFPKSYIREFIA